MGARGARPALVLRPDEEELLEAKTLYVQLVGEAEELHKKAKQTLTDALVSTNGSYFETASLAHRRESRLWLGASVVLTMALLVMLHCGHRNGPPLPEASWLVAMNLSYFGPRVLGASVVSYAIVVCVRSYRSAKHNEVVNAHRARALGTLEKLSEFGTERSREAALLHASNAIFGAQPSGHVDMAAGGSHVVELADAIRPKTKG